MLELDRNETRAANGAPEYFAQIVTWMNDGQTYLDDSWRMALSGEELTVDGRALTPELHVALLEHAANPPADLTIDLANVELATANPYVWTIDKPSGGELKMTGYLPDGQLRQKIYAVLDSSLDDTTLLAEGAPEDFGRLATLAAKAIGSHIPAKCSIIKWVETEIVAKDLFNKNNILQLFSNEEIQPERLGLKLAQLPPPIQSPYRFLVKKNQRRRPCF